MVLGLKVLSLPLIPISFFFLSFCLFQIVLCVCMLKMKFSPMDNLFAMNISGCVLTVIPIRLIRAEHKPLNLFFCVYVCVYTFFRAHVALKLMWQLCALYI